MKVQGRTTSHKQHFAALISSTQNLGTELTFQCLSPDPDTGREERPGQSNTWRQREEFALLAPVDEGRLRVPPSFSSLCNSSLGIYLCAEGCTWGPTSVC